MYTNILYVDKVKYEHGFTHIQSNRYLSLKECNRGAPLSLSLANTHFKEKKYEYVYP